MADKDRSRLLRSGQAAELRYFPGAPVKKHYALMSDAYLNDVEKIRPWIQKSIAFSVDSGG